MSKSIIDIILDQIFDENWKGKRGEELSARELKFTRFCGIEGEILRNVYIPKENGETSEIDLLFITNRGIFVIESKNYSGWIFGDEKSTFWTVMLPNKEKNRFYNPIKQNKSHIFWLHQYLQADVPLFSIIVFSNRCTLKKLTVESTDVTVIQREQLYTTVKKTYNSASDYFNKETLDYMKSKLRALTEVDKTIKDAHIKDIKQKYSSPNQMTDHSICNSNGEKVCPRCGSILVVRTAKTGPNAGKQFYGCSRYPECRFTEKY